MAVTVSVWEELTTTLEQVDPEFAPSGGEGVVQPDVVEAELAARVSDGDDSALGALYDRYGTPCFRVALRVTKNPSLAEEVVQEAFLALWRGSGYTERLGTVRAWLIALCHHKAVDAVRRESALSRREGAYGLPEARDQVRGGDPEAAVIESLVSGEVRAALIDLSPNQREALVLSYFGGYSQREIAELTHVPLGTVKTRMFAGMRRLQVRLSPQRTLSAEESS